jgi:hypothetical protein
MVSMGLRLVACPSCSNYVKQSEPQCIVCGARLRGEGGVVARTAGAVLMGLSMTACPADDTMGDSMAGSESMTPTTDATSTTMAESMSATSVAMTDSGSTTETATDPGSDSTTFVGENAYGVPSTGVTISETGTDTDAATESGTGTTAAETGSTSVSPDYGVPDTTSP